MTNTIKCVIYTDETVVDKNLPELAKIFKEAYDEGKVNHYEVVSAGKKDEKA